MANKVTDKANTANKAQDTTNKVQGTTNNIGQEIKPVQATTDVVSCTMTDDEHKARKERIRTKMEQGLKLSWDIIVDITSAKQRHEQELDGYTKSSEDFLVWCASEFGMGATQVKQAVRLVAVYGSCDDKGEFTLEDKYKMYTKEKLDIIQRHPQFKGKSDFDYIVSHNDINPMTSENRLKEIVSVAKNGITDKQAEQSDTKADKTQPKETEQDVQIKELTTTIETTNKKVDTLKNFIVKQATEAGKVLRSKDSKQAMQFVEKFLKEFERIEKEQNAITK